MLRSNVNFCLRWGNTPLDEAMTFGRVQVVNYLKKSAQKSPSTPVTTEEEEEKPNPPVEQTSPLP